MKGRDDVEVLLAALVVEQLPLRRLLDGVLRNRLSIRHGLGRQFQNIQRRPRISVGDGRDGLERVILDANPFPLDRAAKQSGDVLVGERLKHEYRCDVTLNSTDYRFARWIRGKPSGLAWLKARGDYLVVEDRNDSPVLLADTEFSIDYALQHADGLELYDIEPL